MEIKWLAILAGIVLGGVFAAAIIFVPKFLAKKRIKEGRYCKTCAYYAKHTGFCMSPRITRAFDPELGEYKGSRVFAFKIYNTWRCKWKERKDE